MNKIIGAAAVILTLLHELANILRRLLIDNRFYSTTSKIQLNERITIQESGEAFDIFFLGRAVNELGTTQSKFFVERSWEEFKNIEDFQNAFELGSYKDQKKVSIENSL